MVNPQKVSKSVMVPGPQNQQKSSGKPISPADSARYTADMLEVLRKIAAGQGQGVLAHLLELAQAEARMLIRTPESVG